MRFYFHNFFLFSPYKKISPWISTFALVLVLALPELLCLISLAGRVRGGGAVPERWHSSHHLGRERLRLRQLKRLGSKRTLPTGRHMLSFSLRTASEQQLYNIVNHVLPVFSAGSAGSDR